MEEKTSLIVALVLAIIFVSGIGLISHVYLSEGDNSITGYVVGNVPKDGHYLLSFSQKPLDIGVEVAQINVIYDGVNIPANNTHIKMWYNIVDSILVVHKIEYIGG